MMNQLEVSHFYLRFFDVDWNPYEKEAFPVASFHASNFDFPDNTSFTPAIFITNNVIKNSTNIALDSLAARIIRKTRANITDMIKSGAQSKADAYCDLIQLGYSETRNRTYDSLKTVYAKAMRNNFQEILIDCDWSPQTRTSYFYLLERLKAGFPEFELSATIRLWQYKYREKAGIPPVDRGLLMCYSLENPREYNVTNSISTLAEMKKYLDGPAYPKKLDIALPLFSWGVVFRANEFKGLLSKPEIGEYQSDTLNFRETKKNLFVFKNDRVIGNTYFRYGDELRIEQLSKLELKEMAAYLQDHLKPASDSRITFFSWDTTYIKNYGIENLKTYYQVLHH